MPPCSHGCMPVFREVAQEAGATGTAARVRHLRVVSALRVPTGRLWLLLRLLGPADATTWMTSVMSERIR